MAIRCAWPDYSLYALGTDVTEIAYGWRNLGVIARQPASPADR